MYVSISKDLIHRVENKISRMQKAEIEASIPNIDKTMVVDASSIYNKAAFGEHLHLLDIIPKEWVKEKNEAVISIEFKANSEDTEPNRHVSIRFSGMTAAYCPPSPGEYYGYNNSTKIKLEDVLAFAESTPGRQEIIDRVNDAKVMFEINVRWAKIRGDIVGFLKKCKSLNEAVKLLPTIKMYADKDDIERLERKVDRAPRQDIVLDIDVDTITASAVAARMSGTI
jgi:hypothetical protein